MLRDVFGVKPQNPKKNKHQAKLNRKPIRMHRKLSKATMTNCAFDYGGLKVCKIGTK